jgi:methyl-accepting chemotaxis protein
MKIKSIQMKIAVWAGCCLILTASVIVGYALSVMRGTAARANDQAIESAKEHAAKLAEQEADRIAARLDVAFNSSRSLAMLLAGVKDEEANLDLGREEVQSILKTVLSGNPQFRGVFTCWEPDEFDGMDLGYENTIGHDATGRFLPHWTRNEEGAVDLQPWPGGANSNESSPYNDAKATISENAVVQLESGDETSGDSLVCVMSPITWDGKFLGVVGVDFAWNDLAELVRNVNVYDRAGAAALHTSDGHVCDGSGVLEEELVSLDVLAEARRESVEPTRAYVSKALEGQHVLDLSDEQLLAVAPIAIGRSDNHWAIEIRAPRSKITEAADAQRREADAALGWMIALAIVCTGIALVVLGFAAGKIAKPIQSCVESVVALSQQDFSKPCHVRTHDEVGKMADAINTSIENTKKAFDDIREAAEREQEAREQRAEMERSAAEEQRRQEAERAETERNRREEEDRRREEQTELERRQAEQERQEAAKMRRKVDDLLEVVAAAAEGDLTRRIAVDGNEAIDELAAGIDRMLLELSRIIGQVTESAAQFNEGSRVIAESSQSLASGAQTQSASVEEMSASVEELTRSIEAVKANAENANAAATETNSLAKDGGSAVSRSIEAMELIRGSSNQISEIIQVISEIASQTNLLALNAAIEAARAGEHGMGFAVVADEVRKLAERSNQAAGEISNLIKESTQRVEEGTRVERRYRQSTREAIVSGVESTAAMIAEIATATIEQAK